MGPPTDSLRRKALAQLGDSFAWHVKRSDNLSLRLVELLVLFDLKA